jgi:hypothetical protein
MRTLWRKSVASLEVTDMMGPKTLKEIREELRRALAVTGEDPLRWLEKRMAAPSRRGHTDVLRALRDLLKETPRKGSREGRTRAAK